MQINSTSNYLYTGRVNTQVDTTIKSEKIEEKTREIPTVIELVDEFIGNTLGERGTEIYSKVKNDKNSMHYQVLGLHGLSESLHYFVEKYGRRPSGAEDMAELHEIFTSGAFLEDKSAVDYIRGFAMGEGTSGGLHSRFLSLYEDDFYTPIDEEA